MAPGETKYVLWTCDDTNPNQHFEVLPRASMIAEKRKRLIAAGIDDDIDLLNSGQPLMLRVRGKDNLCADDGGGHFNGETKFVNMPCDPNSANQIFTYDAKTHQFRSVNKPGLCMDDGGGWSAAQTTAHLWDCDPNNQNQWFILDEDNMMLRNPVKPSLCFDDGGGMTAGASKYWLWTCDTANTNQHFEIVSPALMPPLVQQDASVASDGQTLDNPDAEYMETIESGVKVLIRAHQKKNLCLDDGGGLSNAETKFVYQPCDPNSPNQIFSYDVDTKEFQSVNKPGLCLDDGGGWSAGDSTAHLWQCDSGNENQWFVTDPDTMLFHNPAKPGLCFDDTGATEPGKSNFIMWYCNPDTPNQQFEVVPQWELLGGVPDVAPPPLPEIEDGLWSTIDNGNDVLPPPPLSDVLPPVVVDGNGVVVEPTPPNPDDGGVLSNDDTVIAPQVGSSGFGSNGGMTTTSVSDGGIAAAPELQGLVTAYNPAAPSLIDGGSVQPTIANTGWNYGEATGNVFPTTQGPIIEDGGIVVIPPTNDQVVSVQSTDTTSAGWGDTFAQGVDTDTTNQNIATNPTAPDGLPTNPDQVGPVGPVVLPFQEDNNLPIPNVPIIKKADLPLANYGDRDWNLLAPSNDTLSIINKDDSPIISAAKIFKYLQTLKDRADVQHQVTMDRYKRTFQCATDGLKTLAKDAVTNDEYHVLVQWMYDHCAAGATDVKPVVDPSGPVSDEVLKRDDIAQFNDDDKINRQFMTKLDFYYEIKNHYADKNAELVGNAAVANLRSSETLKLEKKLVDCIEEAAERFGYKQDQTSNEDPQDRLKQAIAWVQDTCMAS